MFHSIGFTEMAANGSILYHIRILYHVYVRHSTTQWTTTAQSHHSIGHPTTVDDHVLSLQPHKWLSVRSTAVRYQSGYWLQFTLVCIINTINIEIVLNKWTTKQYVYAHIQHLVFKVPMYFAFSAELRFWFCVIFWRMDLSFCMHK